MTTIHSSNMRTLALLSCISLVSLLAACADNNGYYDANGNYISYESPNNTSHHPNSERTNVDYSARGNGYNHPSEYPHYDRRGYYDHNGGYITRDDGINVPENMFPPRGMCRVWFTQRPISDQPAVESCDNIKSRVPAGAYVIYGG